MNKTAQTPINAPGYIPVPLRQPIAARARKLARRAGTSLCQTSSALPRSSWRAGAAHPPLPRLDIPSHSSTPTTRNTPNPALELQPSLTPTISSNPHCHKHLPSSQNHRKLGSFRNSYRVLSSLAPRRISATIVRRTRLQGGCS